MMLFRSSFILLPLIAMSIVPASTPTAVAASLVSRPATQKHAVVIAQMTQLYCTAIAPAGSIGVTVYDSPDGSVIGRLQDGSIVAFGVGDRSGMWAEVSGEDGTMGWVETAWLSCDDFDSSTNETWDESYEGYEEEYAGEGYDEFYKESSEDSYSSQSY